MIFQLQNFDVVQRLTLARIKSNGLHIFSSKFGQNKMLSDPHGEHDCMHKDQCGLFMQNFYRWRLRNLKENS